MANARALIRPRKVLGVGGAASRFGFVVLPSSCARAFRGLSRAPLAGLRLELSDAGDQRRDHARAGRTSTGVPGRWSPVKVKNLRSYKARPPPECRDRAGASRQFALGEEVNALAGRRDLAIGLLEVDNRFRPWRDLAGLEVAATIDVAADQPAALEQHEADPVELQLSDPGDGLVVIHLLTGVEKARALVGRDADRQLVVLAPGRVPALSPADPLPPSDQIGGRGLARGRLDRLLQAEAVDELIDGVLPARRFDELGDEAFFPRLRVAARGQPSIAHTTVLVRDPPARPGVGLQRLDQPLVGLRRDRLLKGENVLEIVGGGLNDEASVPVRTCRSNPYPP